MAIKKVQVGIFYAEAVPYASQILKESQVGISIKASAHPTNNSADPSDIKYAACYEIKPIPPIKGEGRIYLDQFSIPKIETQDPGETLYSNLTALAERLTVKPVSTQIKKKFSNRRNEGLIFIIQKA